MDQLPVHLQKYLVTQNYEKYTAIDQACWRFVLRQLKAFLSVHAHSSYVEGLEKTGIEIDRIPRIEDISKKLEKYGWRALPVSGFIPPAAFMELQSLGVLPIASDMRTLEHLSYTPAPDIVHEAAGHAPILVNPDFADYLRKYAQVAKFAIISREDLEVYDAIRELSDLKESPSSTPDQIKATEKRLETLTKASSHVSEATELGRMNWWTAEYGLIGSLDAPKIFGAGLLSSVGESKLCLSPKVKKIPLSLDCLKQTYDITEPQPQLYVTPDFQTLTRVLEEMAAKMAYRVGGLEGLKKALLAGSVTTTQLDSGLQISGVLSEVIESPKGTPAYLRTTGPTQLSLAHQELAGHSKAYHAEGFGTPVGPLRADVDFMQLKLNVIYKFEFKSGVIVEGLLRKVLQHQGQAVVASFENCKVLLNERVLFEPAWGIYDMALGQKVVSVFGGPADRLAFGGLEDFTAAKVPAPKWSDQELRLQKLFAEIRQCRESQSGTDLPALALTLDQEFPDEWLPRLEILEILLAFDSKSKLIETLKTQLAAIAQRLADKRSLIEDGLRLSHQLELKV